MLILERSMNVGPSVVSFRVIRFSGDLKGISDLERENKAVMKEHKKRQRKEASEQRKQKH